MWFVSSVGSPGTQGRCCRRTVASCELPVVRLRNTSGNPGERIGLNWRITTTVGKRAIRHVLFDTNFWKSFVHARLVVSQGDPGCLSLFEAMPEQHRLLAEHLTAEYRVRTEGRGRTVDEWKIRPEQSDNHWLDCLVGCAVAAATQGCVLFGTEQLTEISKNRVRLSSLRGGRK